MMKILLMYKDINLPCERKQQLKTSWDPLSTSPPHSLSSMYTHTNKHTHTNTWLIIQHNQKKVSAMRMTQLLKVFILCIATVIRPTAMKKKKSQRVVCIVGREKLGLHKRKQILLKRKYEFLLEPNIRKHGPGTQTQVTLNTVFQYYSNSFMKFSIVTDKGKHKSRCLSSPLVEIPSRRSVIEQGNP